MKNTLKLTEETTLVEVKSKLDHAPNNSDYAKNLGYLMNALFEKYYYHYRQWNWSWGHGERLEGDERILYMVLAKDGNISRYHEKSFSLDKDRCEAWKEFYKEVVTIVDDNTLFNSMSTSNQLKPLLK